MQEKTTPPVDYPLDAGQAGADPAGADPASLPPPADWKQRLRETRVPLWLALVLGLALVLLFVWKQVAVGAAERRLERERVALTEQFAREKAELIARVEATLEEHDETMHVFAGTLLAWAVRGELIRNNLDQIDQFFGELIRNERVRLVLLAGADGLIRLATDRKLQGAPFGDHFPAALLTEPGVAVRVGEAGDRHLVLPIQGLNERLATVVLVYAPVAGLSE